MVTHQLSIAEAAASRKKEDTGNRIAMAVLIAWAVVILLFAAATQNVGGEIATSLPPPLIY
jgi:hypothetical protein